MAGVVPIENVVNGTVRENYDLLLEHELEIVGEVVVPVRLCLAALPGQRLDDIVQPGMLCVFDFDGTLSPIVPQPDSAALPPEVRERLLTLSTLAPVAILTGRSLADIGKRHGISAERVRQLEREALATLRRIADPDLAA